MIFALLFVLCGIALLSLVTYAMYNWPARGADSPNVLHAERCGGTFGGPSDQVWLRIPLVNLRVMRWGVDIAYSSVRLRIQYEAITAVSVERVYLLMKAVRVSHRAPDVPEEVLLFSVKNASLLAALIRDGMETHRP
jgi:hypothetical protein